MDAAPPVEHRSDAAAGGPFADPAVVERLRDALRAGLVFAEPVSTGDVTIVPAARFTGGAGGGAGSDRGAGGEGSGSGMGISGRPAGAFVIREGKVSWQPAVDVNRLVLTGAAIVVTALLTARSIVRIRTTGR